MEKLTDLLKHMGEIVAHVLELADKGMDFDQAILDKARRVQSVIEPLADAMLSSPVTVHVPGGK